MFISRLFLLLIIWVCCIKPVILHCSADERISGIHHLDVEFNPDLFNSLIEHETKLINFTAKNAEKFLTYDDLILAIQSSNGDIAQGFMNLLANKTIDGIQQWEGVFTITGKFLGYAKFCIQLLGSSSECNQTSPSVLAESEPVTVSVIRKPQAIDQAFSYTIAALVSLAFVNLGCSLDFEVVKSSLAKPIGPAIGFCCQYLFMPVCAYGLSSYFLSHNAALQLGLFVTGCSPGGGGSNIWTYLLGGNLNLSITMTCLSTITAFAMMPLWTLTLGRLVFTETLIVVPYAKVATLAAGLLVPLMIGALIRKFFPKVGLFLVKMLKPISIVFIFVVIGFGTYANLYLFKLMDWKVLVCGMLLPWIGYFFGALASSVLQQPWADSLAIAIETGVQNTGIAIFILRFTLEQPAADINTAVPVAVALMTPVPLLTTWALLRCIRKLTNVRKKQFKIKCSSQNYVLSNEKEELKNNNGIYTCSTPSMRESHA